MEKGSRAQRDPSQGSAVERLKASTGYLWHVCEWERERRGFGGEIGGSWWDVVGAACAGRTMRGVGFSFLFSFFKDFSLNKFLSR